MKKTFENLMALESHVNFDDFYAINVIANSITLQGHYSAGKVSQFTDIGFTASIDNDGHIKIVGEINSIPIRIVLT